MYKLIRGASNRIVNIGVGYEPFCTNEMKRSYSIHRDSKYVGVYIGNINVAAKEAAEECIKIAIRYPCIRIIIIGSVGTCFQQANIPKNVIITGMITEDEKVCYLKKADFALNLAKNGAGVNIKMLEYFAYGVPVITTAFGARGIDVQYGKDCFLVDLNKADWIDKIMEFCCLDKNTKKKIARNAKRLFLSRYTWRKVAKRLVMILEEYYGISLSNGVVEEEATRYYTNQNFTKPYLPETPFFIRCAGDFGQACARFLQKYGLQPIAFIDNNDEEKLSIPIISERKYLQIERGEEIIVAKMSDWYKIIVDLCKSGVHLEKISIWFNEGKIFSFNKLRGNYPIWFNPHKEKERIISCLSQKN